MQGYCCCLSRSVSLRVLCPLFARFSRCGEIVGLTRGRWAEGCRAGLEAVCSVLCDVRAVWTMMGCGLRERTRKTPTHAANGGRAPLYGLTRLRICSRNAASQMLMTLVTGVDGFRHTLDSEPPSDGERSAQRWP